MSTNNLKELLNITDIEKEIFCHGFKNNGIEQKFFEDYIDNNGNFLRIEKSLPYYFNDILSDLIDLKCILGNIENILNSFIQKIKLLPYYIDKKKLYIKDIQNEKDSITFIFKDMFIIINKNYNDFIQFYQILICLWFVYNEIRKIDFI